uniref:PEROXIDASE_4 domain-containing protein n=1 Tax=Angiostrongylus cantonensis TaxID=6313 RepID=A0A0K0D1L0_ANGCA
LLTTYVNSIERIKRSFILYHSICSKSRAKRAINPFLDSVGKRVVNPFMDSIGKRMSGSQPYLVLQKSCPGNNLGNNKFLPCPFGK